MTSFSALHKQLDDVLLSFTASESPAVIARISKFLTDLNPATEQARDEALARFEASLRRHSIENRKKATEDIKSILRPFRLRTANRRPKTRVDLRKQRRAGA